MTNHYKLSEVVLTIIFMVKILINVKITESVTLTHHIKCNITIVILTTKCYG